MTFLYIILIISSCALSVRSQSTTNSNQYQRKDVNINSDQIYFSENRQANRNVQPTNNDGDQASLKDQNRVPDRYLQKNPNANFGPFSTTNPNNNLSNDDGSYVQQMSVELQSTSQNINNVQDYFNNIQENYNAATKLGNTNRQGPVPVQDMYYKFNNLSRVLTKFGLNLLMNSDQQTRNVVLSPFSIATLLAVLQQGALGATQQQISAALQMLPDTSADSFKQVNDEFQKRSSRNILRVANNVYVADAFELNPAFKRVAARYFGSEITPTRFIRPQEATEKINLWVAAKTNNKIENLLGPGAIGENSQLVLVNAVYFKGIWQVKFKPESTLPREFHFNDRQTKSVPFMRMRRIFRTGIDYTNGAQVINLPFENEQYSLMVVLPSELSSLTALMRTLTVEKLAEYHNFSPKEVDLEIPKFAVRADTALNSILRKMGVTNMFGDQSELSGLGTYRTYSPQVSAALHTAMLSIDEDGGTAAAATAFAVVALSYDEPSVVFKANRPFLTILWDNQFALPLFMAKVDDPTT